MNTPSGMSHIYTGNLEFIADEFPLAEAADCTRAPELVSRAYNDLRSRAIELEKVAVMVARLNPNAGEIGDGMLRNIVQAAREALNP
jgi:4-hydroxy-L-threonine phosphate dehydrogenase PdxA